MDRVACAGTSSAAKPRAPELLPDVPRCGHLELARESGTTSSTHKVVLTEGNSQQCVVKLAPRAQKLDRMLCQGRLRLLFNLFRQRCPDSSCHSGGT